ncbi:MAG: energy transducer TonB [Akkermansia sp.]|nr:energy transducer TonB [Akkermansia sp.]
MALHVRHNLLPKPTLRVVISLSAVAGLCVLGFLADQYTTTFSSIDKKSQTIQITPWDEEPETTESIHIVPPQLPDIQDPEPLYLIDTTPQLSTVETIPHIDIPDLTEDAPPLMAAILCEITAEDAPVDTKKTAPAPNQSPHGHPTEQNNYTPPQYAATPQPPYPKDLQRRRISGNVRVRIHINAQGTPTAVDILSSSHPAFSQATQHAILTSWRFTPATDGNNCVAATVTTSVVFSCQ